MRITCSRSDLRVLLCRGDVAEKLSQLLFERIWVNGKADQTLLAQSAAAVSWGSISDSLCKSLRQFCLATDCLSSAADTLSNTWCRNACDCTRDDEDELTARLCWFGS
ncbi:unnamed protein product, partial [Ixodes hexagonus]